MATLEAPVRPRTAQHQGPFVTEPFFDFRNEDNARKMRAAVAKVRSQLGREYDLIIGGKRVKTAEKIKSLNPVAAFGDCWRASEGRQGSRGARDEGCARGV